MDKHQGKAAHAWRHSPFKQTFLVGLLLLRLFFRLVFTFFLYLCRRSCRDYRLQTTVYCLHVFFNSTRINREKSKPNKRLNINQQKPEEGLYSQHSISQLINWFQLVDSFYTSLFVCFDWQLQLLVYNYSPGGTCAFDTQKQAETYLFPFKHF